MIGGVTSSRKASSNILTIRAGIGTHSPLFVTLPCIDGAVGRILSMRESIEPTPPCGTWDDVSERGNDPHFIPPEQGDRTGERRDHGRTLSSRATPRAHQLRGPIQRGGVQRL